MALLPVFIDFETYWSVEHSLTKMSAIEYVQHPDTEVQSCSIQIGLDGKAKTYFGYDDIETALVELVPWDRAWVIAHNNSEFDAMVLRWRFNMKPKMWGCTLAMARPVHSKDVGGSLKALAKHYGLEAKGDLESINTKGKYLKDFTESEKDAMRVYNDADTRICAELFKILIRKTPPHELRLIDMTIRMLVEPQFVANTALLERGLKAEKSRKRRVLLKIKEALEDMGVIEFVDSDEELKKTLKSAAKFKKLLEHLGVEVPMKESAATGRMIPALAKNDESFLALRDHENELVVGAVEAKLDTQSSILETRMARFIDVANHCGSKMPVALRYYGADTTGRWSGTMKLNQQNLPRVGGKAKISDVLRKSFVAPKGYSVVVADLSGIELRVNMFLWNVAYAVKLFKSDPGGADLYKHFAAFDLYKKPISEVTKDERQVGKVAHLGLGFGAGYVTFQTVAKLMGGVNISEEESQRIVSAYRKAHAGIAQGWKTCHSALDFISQGISTSIDPNGLCTTTKEGIATPRGIIRYPNLRQEVVDKGGDIEWVYGEGRKKARIYAGKIDENIVQHLARNVIADVALAVDKEIGKHYPLAHMVHDELIYVVKDEDAQDVLNTLQGHMRTPPTWWPELVTWSEGDIAKTYGDAK